MKLPYKQGMAKVQWACIIGGLSISSFAAAATPPATNVPDVIPSYYSTYSQPSTMHQELVLWGQSAVDAGVQLCKALGLEHPIAESAENDAMLQSYIDKKQVFFTEVFCRDPAGGPLVPVDGDIIAGGDFCDSSGYKGAPAIGKIVPVCIPHDFPDRNSCPNNIGNPIDAGSGKKLQVEADFNFAGLKFVRTYNNMTPRKRKGVASRWNFNYFQRFSITPTHAYVTRPDGSIVWFLNDPVKGLTPVVPTFSGNSVLPIVGGGNAVWRYITEDNAMEDYDADGLLLKIIELGGKTFTLTYVDKYGNPYPSNAPVCAGGMTPAPQFAQQYDLATQPRCVTDAFGRQIQFAYDPQTTMLTRVTDPNGNIYSYGYGEASAIVPPNVEYPYDINNLMTSVTYPDGTKRVYWYDEQQNTNKYYFWDALTGITDENGARYATFTYGPSGDNNDDATALSTRHAGGVDNYQVVNRQTFVYTPGTNTITTPLGTSVKMTFNKIYGQLRLTSKSQPAGAGCNASASSLAYDNNGNIVNRADFNGNQTSYTYDLARNLEISRTEAVGTPQARTISTEWHPLFRLRTKVTEPGKVTAYAYDPNGSLLIKTETDTATNKTRSWNYTYNGLGQVLTATNPNGGVMTYTYDNPSGNLTSIQTPAGLITQLSNYDANGLVGRITDPNGLVTDLTYSPRGWLIQRSVSGNGINETTSYSYDGVGQLVKATMPDGSYVSYTYDDAHRLTDVSDSLGNTVHYTLDLAGNRIKEETKDVNGTLARQITRIYDALSRLQQVTGGAQ